MISRARIAAVLTVTSVLLTVLTAVVVNVFTEIWGWALMSGLLILTTSLAIIEVVQHRLSATERDAATGDPPGSGGEQPTSNLTPPGSPTFTFTNSTAKGMFAGGNITQTRHARVGWGGMAALVVAATALATGAVALGRSDAALPHGDRADALRAAPHVRNKTAPNSVTAQGCKPSPCGSSDGVVAYVNDLRIVPYNDAQGYKYSMLRMSWQLVNQSSRMVRFDERFDLFDEQHVKIDAGASRDEEFGCRSAVELQAPPGEFVSAPSQICLVFEPGKRPAYVEFAFWSGQNISVTL